MSLNDLFDSLNEASHASSSPSRAQVIEWRDALGEFLLQEGIVAKDTTSLRGMVEQWNAKKKTLSFAKNEEMEIRKAIVNTIAPGASEGSHTIEVDGLILGVKISFNRKVLDEELSVLSPEFEKEGISVDALIRKKPELNMAAYRKLDDEKRTIFEQCLEIKEGAPELEVKPPKKGGKK